MFFGKRSNNNNNNEGLGTKLELLSLHQQSNNFYIYFFTLKYDLFRDLSGAWDVCIEKRTNATFHLLP